LIPLSIVSGFLGSGKTSLLQDVIARTARRRLVFVVNELGSVDIDGRLLDLPAGQLRCIPGGSIFCRCLAGEFISVLQEIAELVPEPEGVIVETSGISDPSVAWQMFEETGLNSRFALRSVIAVIDPGSFSKLLHTLPNVVAQVEACSVAVVNKIDLHREEEISAVERVVAEINPRATILRAEHARVEIDLLAEGPAVEGAGTYAPCVDPRYHETELVFDRPIDAARLLRELVALGDLIYRAKGFVPVEDGLVFVEYSSTGVTCRPTEADDREHRLVVIARGGLSSDIYEGIAALNAQV
jgi:G3E family GTPase